MKPGIKCHKLLLAFFTGVITLNCHAQQEYTLTTSAVNITSAQAVINLPQLNGNTQAIILAIPQGNTKALNPNPLGVWYYSGKWYVFNSNFAPMLIGLTYKIRYFLTEGPTEFLHLVTQSNLAAGVSYIDHPAINDKPSVQFTIMQNHSPDTRAGSWRNPYEAKTIYNITNGRWYIANINTQPLQKGCAYNIVVAGGSTSTTGTTVPNPTNPVNPPPVTTCNCPSSLPPNGQATGDLAGMYPNPMVTKILNRPLSNTAPGIGQVLKWNGTEWSPSEDITGSSITTGTSDPVGYTAGLGIDITNKEISTMATTPMWNAFQILGRDILTTPPAVGQVLKWAGGAWVPADDIATTATNQLQTFYKIDNTNLNVGQAELTDSKPERILTALTHTIVLTKNSRLVINANVKARGPYCIAGCTDGFAELYMKINNTPDLNATANLKAGWETVNGLINNYMIDLPAGTYKIEFIARHMSGKSSISIFGSYSSIIVIPL